jgi:hypothetical protein
LRAAPQHEAIFIFLKNLKLHPEELCAAKRLEGSLMDVRSGFPLLHWEERARVRR